MTRFILEFWPILLPTLLGFAAVYLLLPSVRASKPAWGVLAGGIALFLLLMRVGTMDAIWQERTLFVIFSAVALGGGVMLVTQRNPAHAALSFTLVIIATCGLFLLNGAPFLMAATLIIYAGAIIVTFLFVIMLAQQSGLADADARSREPFLSSLAGFLLLGAMLCVVQRTYDRSQAFERWREYAPVFSKLQQVLEAKTVPQMHDILGKPSDIDDLERKDLLLAKQLRDYLREPDVLKRPDVNNLELLWNHSGQKDTLTEMQAICRQILEEVSRHGQPGVLFQPPASEKIGVTNIPESVFSGFTSSATPQVDFATGRNKERLPAANVEALGRSLLTDYLVPVLGAAVLLLVATIGAIVIAGRRGEELR